MHTIEIPDIGKKITFPACIEEMTPAQYIAFVGLFMKWKSGTIDYSKFRILLMMMLTKMKISRRYLQLKPEEKQLVDANIAQITDLIDTYFTTEITDGRPLKVLKFDFIKNPLPEIRFKKWYVRRIYGPSDGITNLTFHEYMDACNHLSAYLTAENETSLNKLIAVLYRPCRRLHFVLKYMPRYNGELRTNYNQNTIDRGSVKVGKLPIEIRYGIMLWFRSCDQYLKTAKMKINGIDVDFSILFKADNETKRGIGMIGILYSLAESGIFGDIDKTSKQNLYDIMIRLYQLVLDYEQMKQNMNKQPR